MGRFQTWDEAMEELTTTLAIAFATLSNNEDRKWLLQILDRTAEAYPADSLTRDALHRLCDKAQTYCGSPVADHGRKPFNPADVSSLSVPHALQHASAAHQLGRNLIQSDSAHRSIVNTAGPHPVVRDRAV
jgi:hypothetical protein